MVGRILIPHGITPTGVGIRQRSDGSIRPLSPCCGRLMNINMDNKCYRCAKSYTALANKVGGSLSNDVPIHEGSGSQHILVEWLRRITGIPNLEVDFS